MQLPPGLVRGAVYHIDSEGKEFPIDGYRFLYEDGKTENIPFKEFKHAGLTVHIFDEPIDSTKMPVKCTVQINCKEAMDNFTQQIIYLPI